MEADRAADLQRFTEIHRAALETSGVPPLYWKSLHHKLTHEVFDAGDVFGIMQLENEDVDDAEITHNPGTPPVYKVIITKDDGLQVADANSIFLIDHAWTYRVDQARRQLWEIPGLLHRMANLTGIEFHGEVPDDDIIDEVMAELWRFSHTYQLSQGSAEEQVPIWYVMDEFGSQIQHSDEPTFRTVPFFYGPGQTAFNLLWPLRDLEHGEEVTWDHAHGEQNPLIRKCRLLPWEPANLREVNASISEPPDAYYTTVLADNKEILPLPIEPSVYQKDKIFKVYTELKQVLDNLNSPSFVFTENESEADILYLYRHFKDYRTLSEQRPHVIVNQFPCENLVTVKDCLAAVSRRAGGANGPRWLPLTYNLCTELPQFISCYQQRKDRGEDNHWICKPWNLARGLDTHITDNLNYIIRQRESTPKVVCKYIENPVLFDREDLEGSVKFDIRYIVLLRSVQPLQLYAYNVFWLRFANRPFSLHHFDDYQKHFTVMNYVDETKLKQVHYDEFIPMFEKQYPNYSWKKTEEEIHKSFVELFQVATAKDAPFGICNYPSSRAIYAIDLMLKWDTDSDGKPIMQPQILEVNFSPDCARACKYHPSFFNDVFSVLILDDVAGCPVTRLV
ncbi:tubulin--tyrosine ligase-like protein 12 [Hemiscyllium ocellatum]|uniref:tubulin--tyrosine ligase-like protein 12 n=1 Tax=Hemiscyllium ocellatum TaxID=170820 RepID=UPI00296728E1|nr:tubulin--tyrosine ligase-like protein 12 [Hemiscyllium ocellatum]